MELHRQTLPQRSELLPPKLRDLFFRESPIGHAVYIPSRYKVAYGGRGSGKSFGFASVLVVLGAIRPLRVLCVRETQSSIRESVHRTLVERINDLGLNEYYTIQRESIIGPQWSVGDRTERTEFVFEGIRTDIGKIKSFQSVDVCWVEEGQKVTEESWRELIPTVRGRTLPDGTERQTEFWITFNPVVASDEHFSTYKRFVLEMPPQCRRVEINWNDNPWFPRDLELERQYDLQRIENAKDSAGKAQLRALYDHIWGGKPLSQPVGALFHEQSCLVDGLPTDTPKPVDIVFATMDTAMKDRREHNGTGVCYWALAQHGQIEWPLTLLDWDYIQVEADLLTEYMPTVFHKLANFARECKAQQGSRGVWIEDKSSGIVILQHGRRHDWPTHAIDMALTKMGKTERAFNASPYVHAGEVKMAGEAWYKQVTFKGEDNNHLRKQVFGFTPSNDDLGKDLDLLDAFCYGVAISLGNNEGF